MLEKLGVEESSAADERVLPSQAVPSGPEMESPWRGEA